MSVERLGAHCYVISFSSHPSAAIPLIAACKVTMFGSGGCAMMRENGCLLCGLSRVWNGWLRMVWLRGNGWLVEREVGIAKENNLRRD